jgi:hypothetical protein
LNDLIIAKYKKIGSRLHKPSLVFSEFPSVSTHEVIITVLIAAAANFIVFKNFDKHLGAARRISKLVVLTAILTFIGILFGRQIYWGVIFIMTIGQIILHGWYFPMHGVNGLTAEPYDEYLALINKMKGKREDSWSKGKR